MKSGRRGADGASPVVLHERRLSVVQVHALKNQKEALASAFTSGLRLALPSAGHANFREELTAVWIQPGTWLVAAPFTGPDDLTRRLTDAAAGTAAITDQTFGKSVLRLYGPHARDVLAKGCRVDLHPREFGPGRSAVTPLGQIGCVLIQVDDRPAYDLIVPATFARAAVEWLETAAAEFGLEVHAQR